MALIINIITIIVVNIIMEYLSSGIQNFKAFTEYFGAGTCQVKTQTWS